MSRQFVLRVVLAVIAAVMLIVASMVGLHLAGVTTPDQRCQAVGGVYVPRSNLCLAPHAVIKTQS